jgi:hypothetical protein
MKKDLAVFEGYEIRRIYDEKTETWFFSIVDMSFAEWYAEHKREEIELEEAKVARWTEFRQSRASGTASRHP